MGKKEQVGNRQYTDEFKIEAVYHPNCGEYLGLIPKGSGQVREGAGVFRGRIQQAPFDSFLRLGFGFHRRGTIEFIQAEQ